jgi:hypothetical protein
MVKVNEMEKCRGGKYKSYIKLKTEIIGVEKKKAFFLVANRRRCFCKC